LLTELIESREKLAAARGSLESFEGERVDLEISKKQAACIEQTTRVVNGHPLVNKSELKTTKLRVVKKPQPQFPASERKANVSAAVILRVMVGPDGSVRHLEVVQSSGPAFTEEGKRAALNTKFEPASICGQPVSSTVQLEYSWHTSP
jgi:TonB family protein